MPLELENRDSVSILFYPTSYVDEKLSKVWENMLNKFQRNWTLLFDKVATETSFLLKVLFSSI